MEVDALDAPLRARIASLLAWVSGFFPARAGLAPVPRAPRIRRFQAEQLRVALAWAIRALGLPPIA